MKRALSYPLKLIAKNAGVNGSVVSEKVNIVLYFCYCFKYFLTCCQAVQNNQLSSIRFSPVKTLNMDTMRQPENMKI